MNSSKPKSEQIRECYSNKQVGGNKTKSFTKTPESTPKPCHKCGHYYNSFGESSCPTCYLQRCQLTKLLQTKVLKQLGLQICNQCGHYHEENKNCSQCLERALAKSRDVQAFVRKNVEKLTTNYRQRKESENQKRIDILQKLKLKLCGDCESHNGNIDICPQCMELAREELKYLQTSDLELDDIYNRPKTHTEIKNQSSTAQSTASQSEPNDERSFGSFPKCSDHSDTEITGDQQEQGFQLVDIDGSSQIDNSIVQPDSERPRGRRVESNRENTNSPPVMGYNLRKDIYGYIKEIEKLQDGLSLKMRQVYGNRLANSANHIASGSSHEIRHSRMLQRINKLKTILQNGIHRAAPYRHQNYHDFFKKTNKFGENLRMKERRFNIKKDDNDKDRFDEESDADVSDERLASNVTENDWIDSNDIDDPLDPTIYNARVENKDQQSSAPLKDDSPSDFAENMPHFDEFEDEAAVTANESSSSANENLQKIDYADYIKGLIALDRAIQEEIEKLLMQSTKSVADNERPELDENHSLTKIIEIVKSENFDFDIHQKAEGYCTDSQSTDEQMPSSYEDRINSIHAQDIAVDLSDDQAAAADRNEDSMPISYQDSSTAANDNISVDSPHVKPVEREVFISTEAPQSFLDSLNGMEQVDDVMESYDHTKLNVIDKRKDENTRGEKSAIDSVVNNDKLNDAAKHRRGFQEYVSEVIELADNVSQMVQQTPVDPELETHVILNAMKPNMQESMLADLIDSQDSLDVHDQQPGQQSERNLNELRHKLSASNDQLVSDDDGLYMPMSKWQRFASFDENSCEPNEMPMDVNIYDLNQDIDDDRKTFLQFYKDMENEADSLSLKMRNLDLKAMNLSPQADSNPLNELETANERTQRSRDEETEKKIGESLLESEKAEMLRHQQEVLAQIEGKNVIMPNLAGEKVKSFAEKIEKDKTMAAAVDVEAMPLSEATPTSAKIDTAANAKENESLAQSDATADAVDLATQSGAGLVRKPCFCPRCGHSKLDGIICIYCFILGLRDNQGVQEVSDVTNTAKSAQEEAIEKPLEEEIREEVRDEVQEEVHEEAQEESREVHLEECQKDVREEAHDEAAENTIETDQIEEQHQEQNENVSKTKILRSVGILGVQKLQTETSTADLASAKSENVLDTRLPVVKTNSQKGLRFKSCRDCGRNYIVGGSCPHCSLKTPEEIVDEDDDDIDTKPVGSEVIRSCSNCGTGQRSSLPVNRVKTCNKCGRNYPNDRGCSYCATKLEIESNDSGETQCQGNHGNGNGMFCSNCEEKLQQKSKANILERFLGVAKCKLCAKTHELNQPCPHCAEAKAKAMAKAATATAEEEPVKKSAAMTECEDCGDLLDDNILCPTCFKDILNKKQQKKLAVKKIDQTDNIKSTQLPKNFKR